MSAAGVIALARENKVLKINKNRLELENEELKQKQKILETKHQELEKNKKIVELQNEYLKRNEKRLELENEELKRNEKSLVLENAKTNEEIKKELISEMNEMSIKGVKRLGEVDSKTIMDFCAQKFNVIDIEKISTTTSSIFQTFLKDSKWHPFKIIEGYNASSQEILDDEDEIVKWIKNSYNNEVCDAVIEALKEINEYNPVERETVSELWNFEDNRRATLKESVKLILDELKKR